MKWRSAAWWSWWRLPRYKKPPAPAAGFPPSCNSSIVCSDTTRIFCPRMSSRNSFRVWGNFPPLPPQVNTTTALQEVFVGDEFLFSDAWISTQFNLASTGKLPLILSIVLQTTTDNEGLARKLTGCFKKFPVHLLQDLYQTTAWGRGTVVLPNLTEENYIWHLR